MSNYIKTKYYKKRCEIIISNMLEGLDSIEKERNLKKFCELNGIELILRNDMIRFNMFDDCIIYDNCKFPFFILKKSVAEYLFLLKYDTLDKLEKFIHLSIRCGIKRTIAELELRNKLNQNIK